MKGLSLRSILLILFPILLVSSIPPLIRYCYHHLYGGVFENLEGINTIGLKDKIIVLDPGHGGLDPGAIGLGGLTESEVNLSVAMHLKRMLELGGAHVILTRDKDVTVDLKSRVSISNEAKADLFISIHHNAARDQRNQIETYYAIEGKEVSFDLARYIHRHLVKNLGIKENKIIPGNFSVLRGNMATSVLLEPLYLSNEYVEYLLKDDRAREFEALAIFMGIAEYLSKGVPKITKVWPDGEVIKTPYPRIKVYIEDDSFGPGIDPSTINIKLNDSNLKYYFKKDEGLILSIPQLPLKNGLYTIEIAAKNYNGNSLRSRPIHFTVDLPPNTIEVSPVLPKIPYGIHSPLALSITIKDKYGNPVNDGYEVSIKTNRGKIFPTIDKTKDGKVIAYVVPDKKGDVVVTIRCEEITRKFHWRREKKKGERFAILHLKDKLTNKPIEEAKLILEDGIYSFNKDGYLLIKIEESTKGMIFKEGYHPYSVEFSFDDKFYIEREFTLTPLFGGVLFNKIIGIDPEFGGMEPGVIKDGVRAADVNLLVARFLAKYLQEAGARPFMVRDEDTSLSLLERLLKIERNKPDILLIIGHKDKDLSFSQYYPKSEKGRILASSIQGFIHRDGVDGGITPTRKYLITHTSMPAVYIHPSSVNDIDIARLRSKAYNIFCGILGYYMGLKKEDFYEISGIIRDEENRTLEGVIITLNGCIEIQSLSDGKYYLYLPRTDEVYHLLFTKSGYKPKEISIETNVAKEEIDIVLSRLKNN